jgi:hypothetical protein
VHGGTKEEWERKMTKNFPHFRADFSNFVVLAFGHTTNEEPIAQFNEVKGPPNLVKEEKHTKNVEKRRMDGDGLIEIKTD